MAKIVTELASIAANGEFDWTLVDILALADQLGYMRKGSTTNGKYTRLDLLSELSGETAFVMMLNEQLVTLSFPIVAYLVAPAPAKVVGSDVKTESLAGFNAVVIDLNSALGPPGFVGTPLDPAFPPDHAAARVAVWAAKSCRVIAYWDYEDDDQPIYVGISLCCPEK